MELVETFEFFLTYLALSLLLFGLTIAFRRFQKKQVEVYKLKVVIGGLIGISTVFYVLVSMSNLNKALPETAIYSNIFFFMLIISAYLFYHSILNAKSNLREGVKNMNEKDKKIEKNRKEEELLNFNVKYENENDIVGKDYVELKKDVRKTINEKNEDFRELEKYIESKEFVNEEINEKHEDFKELEKYINYLYEKENESKQLK